MCELAIIINACVDGFLNHGIWGMRAVTASVVLSLCHLCAGATAASKIAYIPTKLCATHYVNNAYSQQSRGESARIQ